ncbi:hypothetical protein PPL_08690 [Heterostelium album PN500]|uniref:Uncharacterized protein n=1 Tax=Heterostelium pallidum (strain ATCC 26659 / Pp 5 / PN500) TaxID=670386 RepID=D3BJG4_HETP5|nr:hypothetical protein PPL_08690 [Heterostelium album PN500]EFA78044.1 hypothetical protein PPL_08690 [Heterostelium album PN500]|eukprot:XP_020430171.1 hypothetical protein PPL_08690 [Heterostelium album PN500]
MKLGLLFLVFVIFGIVVANLSLEKSSSEDLDLQIDVEPKICTATCKLYLPEEACTSQGKVLVPISDTVCCPYCCYNSFAMAEVAKKCAVYCRLYLDPAECTSRGQIYVPISDTVCWSIAYIILTIFVVACFVANLDSDLDFDFDFDFDSDSTSVNEDKETCTPPADSTPAKKNVPTKAKLQ